MKNIVFLLPAFISINYNKEKNSFKDLVVEYGIFCCVINLLVLLALIIVGRANESLEGSDSFKFYFLYLIASVVIAYCLPRIINYCKKNFSFKMKRVTNEKE